MFTGIVSAIGRVVESRSLGAGAGYGKRLTIETPPGWLDDTQLGDSIAISGACMTVASLNKSRSTFAIDSSAESLARTAGLDASGARVNLEQALRAGDRLGGHLVSGHVDGIGTVIAFDEIGESWRLALQAPPELARFLALKGSIAVDGVSLTINRVHDGCDGCAIEINLIPHTLAGTTLGRLVPGAKVNLEIDLIARYVERALNTR